MEVRHLAQADRHISEGERRLLMMDRAIALAVGRWMHADQSRVTLALMAEAMAILKTHRLMILSAIERIDRATTRVALGK